MSINIFRNFIWKTNGDTSQLKFDKTSKGEQGGLNVRKMNLTSNESLVSIESEVICKDYLKSLLESLISAEHFKRSYVFIFHYKMINFQLEKGRRKQLK